MFFTSIICMSWLVIVASQTVAVAMPSLQVQNTTEVTREWEGKTGSADSSSITFSSLSRTVLDDAKYVFTSPFRMDSTDALVLGGVAAGMGGLMAADGDIRDLFQKNRGTTRDDVAEGLDVAGSSYAFFAGHLGLMAGGFWYREQEAGDTLFRVASISLEAQVFTEATSGFLKVAVGRQRPNKGRGTHSYKPFQDLSFDRSFPSSHAARAFSTAAVFADHYPQPIPFLAYSAASLVGLSRILLDEHFSSDVFVGAALGLAIGKSLSWYHRVHKDRWMVLPMLSGRGRGAGLTLRYTF